MEKRKLCIKLTNVLTLTLLSTLTLYPQQPKLLLGIVIDGLQLETVEMLLPYMQKGGFNRFFNKGKVYENIDFGTNLDAVAATSMLLTGATPAVNGISGERIYEPEGRRTEHIFSDSEALGNFTTEGLSPKALKVTTISDEARIAGAGVTYVYSIAATPSLAIAQGAHSANSAVWFNDTNGKWSSTTFYGDMPTVALNANRVNSVENRIDTMVWSPSAANLEALLPQHLVLYPFRYTFKGKDAEKYTRFANSPLLNREITNLAEGYLKTYELGKHDGLDVLNLGYTLKPFEYTKTAENRYELYDSYIKLDSQLSRLFATLDNQLGADNFVVYLSGTPQQPQRRKDDEKWKIPGGEFSSRKAVSLLNLYLIALHGNGDWVKAYHNGHFYLNSELAKEKEVDIETLRRQTSDFLVRMAGVGHSYTIDDVVNARPIVPNARAQARNTVIPASGDVIIELMPGWSLVDDFNFAGATASSTFSLALPTAVFMVYGPNIKAERISTPLDARAIAPSLAGFLHIRSPNGSDTPGVSFRK